jgi:acyl carrier protein
MNMTVCEIETKVREMIADVLALELSEVQPQSRFFEDLGGDSLDLLDFAFRAEKEWQVRMSLKELSSGEKMDVESPLTPQQVSELKQRAPFLNFTLLEQNPQARGSELFTVSALVDWVYLTIQQKEPKRSAAPGS